MMVDGHGDLLKARASLRRLDSRTFPEFVRRTLNTTYPGIKAFGANKDGAIDLVCDGSSRVVFQCKFISGSADPTKAWLLEQGKLDRSLRFDDTGALVGQSQYLPWSDTTKPIRKYVLCHSLESVHLKGLDDLAASSSALAATISAFFRDVVASREGFQHLSSIDVDVLSGDDLVALCEQQPPLAFALFGPALPHGVIRVTDPRHSAGGPLTFDRYLSSDHLPYFSRTDFISGTDFDPWRRPQSVPFLVEADIIDKLFTTPAHRPVLLLTGPGGYGKSRLAIELCRAVEISRDALTFQLSDTAAPSDVVDLCRLVPPGTEVLLYIDYLETQQHFFDIVDTTVALNRDGLSVRILASCRSSYYRSEISDDFDAVVDLTDTGADLHQAYRHATFRFILEKAGFAGASAFAERSGHNPVLAAFVLYLLDTASDRQRLLPDLRTLIEEDRYHTDLSHWIVRRLSRSAKALIGEVSVSTIVDTVAPLLAVLPVRQDTMLELQTDESLRRYLEILIHDRLVERREIPGSIAGGGVRVVWAVAHDVVADYFLSRALSASASPGALVERVFALAIKRRLIRNAVISFQRAQDSEALGTLSWKNYFDAQIVKQPHEWRDSRHVVLRTSLLSAADKVAMIAKAQEYWADLKNRRDLDRCLVHIAAGYRSWFATARDADRNTYDNSTLLRFLDEACAHDATGYACLSRALRYNPTYFAARALRSIARAPLNVDLHFLLVAWLDSGLDPGAVRVRAIDWLNAGFGVSAKAQFVLSAWLGNVVDKRDTGRTREAHELLSPYVRAWLALPTMAASFEARFVITSWLRAAEYSGKNTAADACNTVFSLLDDWVRLHGLKPGSEYVYFTLLNTAYAAGSEYAGQAIDVLEEHLVAWLNQPGRAVSPNARFVMSGWLIAGLHDGALGAKALDTLTPYLTTWCAGGHSADSSSALLLNDWLTAARYVGGARLHEALSLATPYCREWLALPGRSTASVASFIYASWLLAALDCGEAARNGAVGELREMVAAWTMRWSPTGAPNIVSNAWDNAKLGIPTKRRMQSAMRRLWEMVDSLAADATPAALSGAARDLAALHQEVHFRPQLGRKVRLAVINDILKPCSRLIAYPELASLACELSMKAIRHPQLFAVPFKDTVQSEVAYCDLVAAILVHCDCADSDLSALNRFVKFWTSASSRDGQGGPVADAWQALLHKYPNDQLWSDVQIRLQ